MRSGCHTFRPEEQRLPEAFRLFKVRQTDELRVCCVLPGLNYTRNAFGPCTAPGVPADSCKVVYMEDIASDDGELEAWRPGLRSKFHGTNVAGIIAGTSTVT